MPADPSRDCIFCRIVRRELPAGVVAENADTLAFMDIRPVTPGHTLVIPKRHAAVLAELPPAVGGEVFAAAMGVAAALRKSGLKCEGVNLYLADGSAAGQEVPHVHLHVVPRFHGDGYGLRFPPGYGKMLSAEERDAAAAKIRAAMPPSGRA